MVVNRQSQTEKQESARQSAAAVRNQPVPASLSGTQGSSGESLPLAGGTMTGNIIWASTQHFDGGTF